MLPSPTVLLPTSEPIALLDATLLFIIQMLIANHPDLLAPPETPPAALPGLWAARHTVDAVRELHHALDSYRTVLAEAPPLALEDDPLTHDISF